MALPEPTTLVLVRHGVTAHTTERRFSGGLAGADPGLSDEGRVQARSTGEWLLPLAGGVGLLVTSPVRRTRETAAVLADVLGLAVAEEPGLAEMEFGTWDGKTFAEVSEEHEADLQQWFGSVEAVPGGHGESFRSVQERVLAAQRRLLASHDASTLVVVSHVTPIKAIVADALQAPLESLFRMELAPASVTVVDYYPQPDGPPHPSLRMFNALPPDRPAPFAEPRSW